MTPLALDIAIACVILLSTVVAYMRGIIKEMFTIVGLLIAAFIAYKLGHVLVPEFNELLNVPEDGISEDVDYVLFGLLSPAVAAMAAAYGSTFATVLLVVLLLGRMFSKWVKEAGMEIVDKALGAGFGFIRGFLVVFVIYIPFNFLIDSDDMPKWAKESYSVASFDKTFSWMNKELKLNEKIEERSEGVVIKFDKIDPKGTEEGDEAPLSDALETITNGASGVADTLKEAMSSMDDAMEADEAPKRNRLLETKEEKEVNDALEAEQTRLKEAQSRLEEEMREERRRIDEKKRIENERRRREVERRREEERSKAQDMRREEEARRLEEIRSQRREMEAKEAQQAETSAEATTDAPAGEEYVPSPSINSYKKSGDFVEQKKTPEDFYNPNEMEAETTDPYRETYEAP